MPSEVRYLYKSNYELVSRSPLLKAIQDSDYRKPIGAAPVPTFQPRATTIKVWIYTPSFLKWLIAIEKKHAKSWPYNFEKNQTSLPTDNVHANFVIKCIIKNSVSNQIQNEKAARIPITRAELESNHVPLQYFKV